MPLIINNHSGLFQNEIDIGVQNAIRYLPQITNVNLQENIQDRLINSGIITTRTTAIQDRNLNILDDCYRNHQRPSYCILGKLPIFIKKNGITLCICNLNQTGRINRIWEFIIHEFAHTCDWNHGDGMGIPGNLGIM